MKKIVFLSAGLILLFALSAVAQNDCVVVRAIAQQHLLDFGNPDFDGGEPGYPWVGPVQLALGKNEVLLGKISGFDGEPGPSHHTGQGRDTGNFVFDFGADGRFTVHYSHALWPVLPKFGATFTGTFHAEGSADGTGGTGRFVKATGHFAADGPFVAWNLDAAPPSARFNNTITGMLCGVLPK